MKKIVNQSAIKLKEIIENIKNEHKIKRDISDKNSNINELNKVIKKIKAINKDKTRINQLDLTIKDIEKQFIIDFQNKYLDIAKEILDKFEKGLPTPVLSICGKGTQEIRFSKYLGYMLNPDNLHGLDKKVLEYGFKAIIGDNKMKELLNSKLEVYNEYYLGEISGQGCYIDILIISENQIIAIEQKILSGESNDGLDISQLDRYSKAIISNDNLNKKEITKIYLTPNEKINNKKDWINVSYRELIKNIIEIYRHEKLNPITKMNLSSFVIDLLMGPHEILEDNFKYIIKASKEVLNKPSAINYSEFKRLYEKDKENINILKEMI